MRIWSPSNLMESDDEVEYAYSLSHSKGQSYNAQGTYTDREFHSTAVR